MKIEMPPEWAISGDAPDEWIYRGHTVYVSNQGDRVFYAGLHTVDTDHDKAQAHALTLARALTPGWVVVEQNKIDVLESMLDAATAREEDLQRELDDVRRHNSRLQREIEAMCITIGRLEMQRDNPPPSILSRVRRLFGGAR